MAQAPSVASVDPKESEKMVGMRIEMEKIRSSLAIEQVYDMEVYYPPYYGYGDGTCAGSRLYYSILTYRHPFALWL